MMNHIKVKQTVDDKMSKKNFFGKKTTICFSLMFD